MPATFETFITYFISEKPYVLLAAAVIYLSVTGNSSFAGWLLTGFFLSLSFAFRSSFLLRGFSYTLVIFAAVSLACPFPIRLYPHYSLHF